MICGQVPLLRHSEALKGAGGALRHLTAFFPALLALAATISCGSKPVHKYSYLALGDSYTIGEAVPAGDRWPVQLATLLRKEGIDLADPEIVATTGWTTTELQEGIAKRKDLGKYDLVTLLIGVNNQYRGQSLDAYRKEFKELLLQAVDFAKGRRDRVIVVSIPDYGLTPFAAEKDAPKIARELDAFNAAAREVAELEKVAFVDITTKSREVGKDPAMTASDGLHPSGKLYELWADLVLPVARRSLSGKGP